MKLWITSVLVLACACVFTQGGRAQELSAQDASKKEHSITGCLQTGGAPNTYVLGFRERGGPRTMSIVSSSADLAPLLRHRVEITGTIVSAKEAEMNSNVPKALRYMRVTAVKTVSDTCDNR